jgi:hypothetical protein
MQAKGNYGNSGSRDKGPGRDQSSSEVRRKGSFGRFSGDDYPERCGNERTTAFIRLTTVPN